MTSYFSNMVLTSSDDIIRETLPVTPSSALGHSKAFHLLGADSRRERSSALSVCSRVFLFTNMNGWVKENKNGAGAERERRVNWEEEDTGVCSGARRPAATPACRREMGRWLSAPSSPAGPDCPGAARTAGRLQWPGYWWNLSQTEEKTWSREGGWLNNKKGTKLRLGDIYNNNTSLDLMILLHIVISWYSVSVVFS